MEKAAQKMQEMEDDDPNAVIQVGLTFLLFVGFCLARRRRQRSGLRFASSGSQASWMQTRRMLTRRECPGEEEGAGGGAGQEPSKQKGKQAEVGDRQLRGCENALQHEMTITTKERSKGMMSRKKRKQRKPKQSMPPRMKRKALGKRFRTSIFVSEPAPQQHL